MKESKDIISGMPAKNFPNWNEVNNLFQYKKYNSKMILENGDFKSKNEKITNLLCKTGMITTLNEEGADHLRDKLELICKQQILQYAFDLESFDEAKSVEKFIELYRNLWNFNPRIQPSIELFQLSMSRSLNIPDYILEAYEDPLKKLDISKFKQRFESYSTCSSSKKFILFYLKELIEKTQKKTLILDDLKNFVHEIANLNVGEFSDYSNLTVEFCLQALSLTNLIEKNYSDDKMLQLNAEMKKQLGMISGNFSLIISSFFDPRTNQKDERWIYDQFEIALLIEKRAREKDNNSQSVSIGYIMKEKLIDWFKLSSVFPESRMTSMLIDKNDLFIYFKNSRTLKLRIQNKKSPLKESEILYEIKRGLKFKKMISFGNKIFLISKKKNIHELDTLNLNIVCSEFDNKEDIIETNLVSENERVLLTKIEKFNYKIKTFRVAKKDYFLTFKIKSDKDLRPKYCLGFFN